MKIKQNTYVNIQSWMITELDLKGSELIIYAVIYGFCQDGESLYKGGQSYLAAWANSSKRGVQKCLDRLIEKGYIAKKEKRVNGVKKCDYYVTSLPWENDGADGRDDPDGITDEEQSSPGVANKVRQGSEQSSPGVANKVRQGGEQSSHNNIYNNIKDNIKSTSSSDAPPESVRKKSSETEQVVEAWNQLSSLGVKAVSRLDPSSERYKMLHERIRQYGFENVLKAIGNIKHSSFLCGSGKKGWSIKFDWFVRPNNFPKVLEGNYDDVDTDSTSVECKTDDNDAGVQGGGVMNGGDREREEWISMFGKFATTYRKD